MQPLADEPFTKIQLDSTWRSSTHIGTEYAALLVDPGYLAAHVKRALLDALGNGILPNGTKGLFHPDNLTFGQSMYASQIIAAAQMEDGVESVTMDRLERLLPIGAGGVQNYARRFSGRPG